MNAAADLEVARIDVGYALAGDLALVIIDAQQVQEVLLLAVLLVSSEAGPQNEDLGLLQHTGPFVLQVVYVDNLLAYN